MSVEYEESTAPNPASQALARVATLGSFLLLTAFVVASGALRRCWAPVAASALIAGGIRTFIVTALMLAASAIMVHAFVTATPRTAHSRCSTNSRRIGAVSTGPSCSG